MDEPTTFLLLICVGVLALGMLIVLFIFGSFSAMARSMLIAFVVKLLNLGRGDKVDQQPFTPEQGHESLGDLLVERSDELNFEAAVARHGGASTGTGLVQAQPAEPPDANPQQSLFGRAMGTVSAPLLNVRQRLRRGNPSPPPLPTEGDIDADI